MSQLLVKGNSR